MEEGHAWRHLKRRRCEGRAHPTPRRFHVGQRLLETAVIARLTRGAHRTEPRLSFSVFITAVAPARMAAAAGLRCCFPGSSAIGSGFVKPSSPRRGWCAAAVAAPIEGDGAGLFAWATHPRRLPHPSPGFSTRLSPLRLILCSHYSSIKLRLFKSSDSSDCVLAVAHSHFSSKF